MSVKNIVFSRTKLAGTISYIYYRHTYIYMYVEVRIITSPICVSGYRPSPIRVSLKH